MCLQSIVLKISLLNGKSPLWKVTYRFKVSVFQPGAFDNEIGKLVY